jgi:ADP-ribosylglycohydrolase
MNRFEEIVWGGLVADAATMGLHWIYNQKRIAKIAKTKPEFFDCDPANYVREEGESEKAAYFLVHEGKKAGDMSQYGEQLLVMLKALAMNKGTFNKMTFEDIFYNFFGPGGDWVGYIDRPTDVTLYNYKKRERDAYDKAGEFDNGLSEEERWLLDDKVMVLNKFYDESKTKEENRKKFHDWIVYRRAFDTEKDDLRIEYCNHMFDVVYESKQGFCGDRGDDQLPTIAKLPPLVALYHDKDNFEEIVEEGARLTNNNNRAVSFALVYGTMLKAAIETRDRMAVIEAAKVAAAPYPELTDLIERALSMVDKPHNEAALYFGITCHLTYSLPHDIILLHNCDNYVDAIRMNIFAGGDNCGRSAMIGAMYAALYGQGENGLPQEWVNKLTKKQEIEALTAQIDC